ncbi:chromosome partitioning protein [Bradyrhizobium centrolobii]|uniref:Chromosome partitioning protein n=1 Tax=Bradyrhizobium centrolobii TaxID=1505087 RepID=A0A176Z2P3_9BRAD|nr:AAA family ATPase [Bradyrhizobium centrolobii]OAF13480.1 chromosome partitioning protein [Bradyrhizobium centrolobii]
MIVSKLQVSGFRGIRTCEINFSKFNTFVGPNNCGKTTIAEALALVLGRDRLVRTLTEHDFIGSEPKETDRIIIVASITGFLPNDPARQSDWFRWGRATIKWTDVDSGAVKVERSKNTDLLTCQIAFAARFDLESLEVVTARYFYDTGVDPFADDAAIEQVPADLIRRLGFFLVPASRTWDRTISFGSELFRRVVSYVGGKPAAAVLAERARLRTPKDPLEADSNLRELVSNIDTDLAALLGQETRLKLRLTTTDSEGILESVFPHFSNGDKIPLPSRRHGSGLISLQTLILLMRFGQVRVANGEGFLMVIEEPELHVPPPLQRKLLRMMQAMATQTIVTTHSPTIASVPNPHEIQFVANSNGALVARPLTKRPLAPDAQNPIRSLLLSARDATIYALMHPSVLVPEGRIDAAWLRQFVKILELGATNSSDLGLSFAQEVGPIPTADARAREVYEHLREVHPLVFCLFDGDAQGDNYTSAVCTSKPPPHIVARWPKGWAIEHVVGWIAEGDPSILARAELAQIGVPSKPAELVGALQGKFKTDEIVHGVIADAFVESEACRRRIGSVMQFVADIAMGRRPPTQHKMIKHANGTTVIWTLSNAVLGI